jgi:hypothetical protein
VWAKSFKEEDTEADCKTAASGERCRGCWARGGGASSGRDTWTSKSDPVARRAPSWVVGSRPLVATAAMTKSGRGV